MTISAKIELDTRSTKKDGTHPLKLLIVIGRKSLRIAQGYSITAKEWNEKSQSVKTSCKRYPNITRLNNLLHKERTAMLGRILELQDEGVLEQMSMAEIKKRITGSQDDTFVLQFADTVIAELQQAKKVGNARVYTIIRNSISTYLGGKDVPLKQISYTWLKRYEAWYLGRGNTINGLSVNLRTLRALYNRAIKRKLVPQQFYPFKEYSIKHETTKKRAISASAIEQIKVFVPTTLRQERAKDYFLMSFYLMGASFVDIALLKVSDIRKGRVEYKRKKTGKLHSIKITSPLQTLLDKYMAEKTADDFVLNVIKENEIEGQYMNVRNAMRRYNKSLKEIGQLCGIEQPLTSYVARHSFATIAKYKDVPIAVISQALGHSDMKTTETYLAAFEDDTMDAYNEMIIGE